MVLKQIEIGVEEFEETFGCMRDCTRAKENEERI